MRILFRKSLYILGILVILLGLTPMLTVQAAPYIINTDTNWSGTIYLDRDVRVNTSAKLTIEPGTQVIINSSDQFNTGFDEELVEIIIDGELEAIGAEFYRFGGAASWYGIRTAGNTEIRDCVFRNAITTITINDFYRTNTIIIEGNEITNSTGKPGTVGSIHGKAAYGIHVIAGKPLIANNHIHNIQGGTGLAGALGQTAGAGGSACGICQESTLVEEMIIVGNLIESIRGGNGGAGYDGKSGSNGSPGTQANPDGGSGAHGQHGSAGGMGNMAFGIRISEGTSIEIVGNHILNISSGYGGRGGHGGAGGAGGAGATAADGAGGNGGTGGNGGAGGNGGNSGFAYGLSLLQASDLVVTNNRIEDVKAGFPGVAGYGGHGGNGGRGGNQTENTKNPGVGASGGEGGMAGSGGSGGEVYGIYLDRAGFSDAEKGLNANQIFHINAGAAGGPGGWGGNGGSGGNGGRVDSAIGIGGAGGAGGAGGMAGNGGKSSIVRAMGFICLTACNPGPIVNNVVAYVRSERGGPGGVGGMGGDGGNGGTSPAPAPRGAGGHGGNSGNGGNGGISSQAELMSFEKVTTTVTNNTLYHASRHQMGGELGSRLPAGSGGTGVPNGNDGMLGSLGLTGDVRWIVGIFGSTGTYQVYNNVIANGETFDQIGYGILRGSTDAVISENYNLFHQWHNMVDSSVSSGGNSFSADPKFIDADADALNFSVHIDGGGVEEGDNNAPARPDSDILDNPRPFDADGDGIAIVDIGAYEFNKFLLITHADFGEIIKHPDKGLLYDLNDQVTLTAIASQGFVFTHWSGAYGTANPLTITMTKNVEIEAFFIEDLFPNNIFLPLIRR